MAYLPADNKAGLLIGNYLTYATGPSQNESLPPDFHAVLTDIRPGTYLRTHLGQRVWSHEEDHDERSRPHVVLSRQYSWSLDIPRSGCAAVHPCQNHHFRNERHIDLADTRVACLLHVGQQETGQDHDGSTSQGEC